VLLAQLRLEVEQLAGRIERMDAAVQREAREQEACQRLTTTIPGVGPVTATALMGAIGNGSAFGKGRDLSAWEGNRSGRVHDGQQAKAAGHQQARQ
jgi:transposase